VCLLAISWVPHIRGWVGGSTLPVDAIDQAVYPVGQTNSHGSPTKLSRHSMEKFWIPSHPLNALWWPHRVCFGLSWFERVGKKPSVKAYLVISAILLLCLDSALLWLLYKSSHICVVCISDYTCGKNHILLSWHLLWYIYSIQTKLQITCLSRQKCLGIL